MTIDNLTREQKHNVLRFLLHRMSLETRVELMAEMPVAYARLYPGVDPAVVVEQVTAAMAAAQGPPAPEGGSRLRFTRAAPGFVITLDQEGG